MKFGGKDLTLSDDFKLWSFSFSLIQVIPYN
jgi:hypothetical protein